MTIVDNDQGVHFERSSVTIAEMRVEFASRFYVAPMTQTSRFRLISRTQTRPLAAGSTTLGSPTPLRLPLGRSRGQAAGLSGTLEKHSQLGPLLPGCRGGHGSIADAGLGHRRGWAGYSGHKLHDRAARRRGGAMDDLGRGSRSEPLRTVLLTSHGLAAGSS